MTLFNRHNRYRNQLSAYVDNQLSAGDTKAVDQHLATCDACRQELEGLRAIALAVRDLPSVAAPRSFALTPELVGERPAPARERLPQFAGGMRLAGAALAVALAVVLTGDVTNVPLGGDGGQSERSATADMMLETDNSVIDNGSDFAASPASQPPADAASEDPKTQEQLDAAGRDSDNCPVASGEGGDSGVASATAPAVTTAPEPVGVTATPAAGVDKGVTAGDCVPAAGGIDSPAVGAPDGQAEGGADDKSAESLSQADDGGLSTVRVIEIALAVALAAVLISVLATAVANRRTPR